MPIINVQILTGRTDDQKRALVDALATATMEALGAPEQSIRVILTEVEPRHWGIGTRIKADLDRAPS